MLNKFEYIVWQVEQKDADGDVVRPEEIIAEGSMVQAEVFAETRENVKWLHRKELEDRKLKPSEVRVDIRPFRAV